MKRYQLLLLSFLLVGLASCSISVSSFSFHFNRVSHAVRAHELREAGQYDEAIAEYRLHIGDRLSTSGKPPEENPYFYYLLIGDIYLDTNRLKEAEEAYLLAKDQEVEQAFLSDRFRRIAKWHENRGDLQQAIDTLRKYRLLDPLLYDVIIDRLDKQRVTLDQKHDRLRDSWRR